MSVSRVVIVFISPPPLSGYVDQLWVNRPWPFIPAWSLKPGIAQNGCLTLDTHQLTWNGVGGGGEMALHLGMATSLDKIEFIGNNDIDAAD